jgi:hypothetical protein
MVERRIGYDKCSQEGAPRNGHRADQETYCSDGVIGFGEYMVDVMWWNRITSRPEAVFESEWGTIDDIVFDFKKLLYVKSPLKVMICDPQKHREQLIPELESCVRSYPDH